MKCLYLKSNEDIDFSKSVKIDDFKTYDYTEVLKSLVFLKEKIIKEFESKAKIKNYKHEFIKSENKSLSLTVWEDKQRTLFGIPFRFLKPDRKIISTELLCSPVLNYVHKKIGDELSKTLLICNVMTDIYLHSYSGGLCIQEFRLKYFILCNILNGDMNLFNEANINELCLNLFFPNINVLEFSSLDNFVVNVANIENNKVILCVRTTGNIEKEFVLLEYDKTNKYENFALDAISKLYKCEKLFSFLDNRYMVCNSGFSISLSLNGKCLTMSTFNGSIYVYTIDNGERKSYIFDQESFGYKVQNDNPYDYSFILYDKSNSCVINCGIEIFKKSLKEINYEKGLPSCE